MSDTNSALNLQRLLRELAAGEPKLVSPTIEIRLRQAVRARAGQRRRNIAVAICLAACLLIAVAWRWSLPTARSVAPPSEFAGFLALPYAQNDIPMEQMVVVRVDLDAAGLRRLGLPLSSIARRKQTRADLLIGQDGMARAVRFAQ